MGKRVLRETKKIADLLRTQKSIAVYDVETTGLHPESGDRVIQFAGIILECKQNYVLTDKINIFVNPGFPVSSTITDLTGITNEKLSEEGLSENDAFNLINDFFKKVEIISGYNVKFDNGFMKDLFLRNGASFNPVNIIDPYVAAKELVNPEELTDGKRTLENVSRYYGVQKEGFHNAYIDVINTVKVLFAEMNDYENQKDNTPANKIVMSAKRLKYSRQNDFLYINLHTGETLRYNLYKGEFDDTEVIYNADDIYRQVDEYAVSRGYVSAERMKAS